MLLAAAMKHQKELLGISGRQKVPLTCLHCAATVRSPCCHRAHCAVTVPSLCCHCAHCAVTVCCVLNLSFPEPVSPSVSIPQRCAVEKVPQANNKLDEISGRMQAIEDRLRQRQEVLLL